MRRSDARHGHRPPARRWGRAAAAVAALDLVAGVTSAPPALAAKATATLTQETGTAPFNTASGAGYDVSATDGVVRTNDLVTYVISVGIDGETMTSPHVTMTFPQGQEMTSVPAFCKAGSSLTPASIPAPDPATLTSTTWQSLPTQTLVCAITDVAPGAAVGVRFTTRVRPEMPNGAVMGPVSATITNTNPAVPAGTTATVQQTVSAAAKWDVSVNGAAGAVNTAFLKQSTVQRCSLPSIPRNPDGSNQMCYVGGYPVTVSIPDGGRGGTPMAGGNFTLALDVDPVTIWGPNAAGLDPALWGGYLGVRQDSPYESPNSYLAQGTALNSVRSSGTIETTQPGGPGTPIVIKVTGADTTAYTVPTDAGAPANFKVRTDRGYVWTQRIFVEIPMTSLMNQGDSSPFDTNPAPGVTQAPVKVVTNESSLTGWASVTGLSGSGNTNLWSNPAGQGNNYRQGVATLRDYVPATAAWVSPVGYATDTAPIVFAPGFPAWEGPSGPTGKDTGDGVAVEGQTVLSMTHLNGDTLNGVTTLICQTFDNTKVALARAVTRATAPPSSRSRPTSTPPTPTPTRGARRGSRARWSTSTARPRSPFPTTRARTR